MPDAAVSGIRAAAPADRRLWIVLGLALCGVGFAAPASPAVGSAIDAALLKIEAPAKAVAEIRLLPKRVGEKIQAFESRQIPPAALAAAVETTEAAFDPAAASTTFEAALTAVPDGDGGEALSGIADRFAAAVDAQTASLAGTDPEAAARRLQGQFDRRPDRARIEELALLMAAPELRSEVMLAALRIEKALNVPHIAGTEKLAALDGAGIDTEVRRLVTETRQEPGELAEPFSRALGVLEGQARIRAQLLALTEADVERLHAFYSSPVGRAKRDALTTSFAALNDEHAVAMLTAYLKKLRKPAP